MNWNHSIRRFHRWMSIAFTLAVIVTMVSMAQQEPVAWLTYLPLFPLALLQFTGLYLLVEPHAARWRSARRSG